MLKIIELKAKNIKNLKAIEIRPEGNEVILKGKNGAGKSAILDSILIALTGKKFDQPIRNGEDKAEISLDLGDYLVKKKLTAGRGSLEVITKNGFAAPSPQGLLDNIIGKISFDPLAFTRYKTKEQADLLRQLANLNLSDLDNLEKEAYDNRTIVNRTVKELEGKLAGREAPDATLPAEEVSFKDELEKINQLREKRRTYRIALDNKAAIQAKITKCDEEVLSLERRIKELQDSILNIKGHRDSYQQELESFPMPTEISDEVISVAENALSIIEVMNNDIKAAKEYRILNAELEDVKKKSDSYTSQIERCQEERKNRIAAAKFPIEGLSVEGDVVFYKNIPFDRLSTGQQIRVSTAIAMALNPQLRVIMIREGSLLDDAGLFEIVSLAKEKDYQIWIEKVEDGQPVGIHIEDGSIVENPIEATV